MSSIINTDKLFYIIILYLLLLLYFKNSELRKKIEINAISNKFIIFIKMLSLRYTKITNNQNFLQFNF